MMRPKTVWKVIAVVVGLTLSGQSGTAFAPPLREAVAPKTKRSILSTASSNVIVSNLLDEINRSEPNTTVVGNYIDALEQETQQQQQQQDQSNLDPLFGLYDVSYVQTVRKNDNPVGGKWTRHNGVAQKLLRTRRTLQHILRVNETGWTRARNQTVVAEAINVVALEALGGLWRTTVLLRGDAVQLSISERSNSTRYCQTLSPRAVRALFDAPRIVFGRSGIWNFVVGPKSSVVLDTTYVDDRVRIGLGARSGTRFVFKKCHPDDEIANEFRTFLARKPMGRKRTLAVLATVSSLGIYGARRLPWIGGPLALVSAGLATLFAFSGGGIEQNDRSVQESIDALANEVAQS